MKHHLTQTCSGSEIIICMKVRARYILLHITARKSTNRGNTMPYWSFYFYFMFWILVTVWVRAREPCSMALYCMWRLHTTRVLVWSLEHSLSRSSKLPIFCSFIYSFIWFHLWDRASSHSKLSLSLSAIFNGVSHLANADLCWYRWSFVAIRYAV